MQVLLIYMFSTNEGLGTPNRISFVMIREARKEGMFVETRTWATDGQ
jgi:hypothetical protein